MQLQSNQDQEFDSYSQTLDQLQERAAFFEQKHLSYETNLTFNQNSPYSSYSVHSIWQMLPQYRDYSVTESPLDPVLNDIYSSNHHKPRFVLPPASQGQESINQEEQLFQPNFKWISSALIQSNLIQVDQIEPRKIQKDNIPSQWLGINQLLLHNIKQKIYKKSQVNDISIHLHSKFSQFPWVIIKRIKQVYYKGKPSIIVRFTETRGASFAYYNFVKYSRHNQEFFGDQCEVYRITKNRLKQKKIKVETLLVFRKMPISMTKQSFLGLLKKHQLPSITWIQQLVSIQNFKYTLCKLRYLDSAFQICEFFQLKYQIKEMKINLHPKSGKVWKNSEGSEQFISKQIII